MILTQVLKTGLTPSASGSAYLEIEPSPSNHSRELSHRTSSPALKLTCTVHGPKPLTRSAPFTPHALLSTHIKFAPFAAKDRKGYIRDATERDLSLHLQTALRGVIIGERWPKSGLEIVITVLEGDEASWWIDETESRKPKPAGVRGYDMMNILAGCITVASAAIADASVDCVDLVTGGVAAVVVPSTQGGTDVQKSPAKSGTPLQDTVQVVRDPCPDEHQTVIAACVVGYLAGRDELTELWLKGGFLETSRETLLGVPNRENLVDQAVASALAARSVLEATLMEVVDRRSRQNATNNSPSTSEFVP